MDNKEKLKNQENIDDTVPTEEMQPGEMENTEEGATSDEPAAIIQELNKQVGEQKDKYLRLLAEFENYKRRTAKERLETIQTASKDILSALVPVLDDFDRAKRSAESAGNELTEGFLLIYNKLYSVLKQSGLQDHDPTGQPFDPEHHEAITEIPAPTGDLKGKVVDTIEKGYSLYDKIIRYAKVVVGK